MKRVALLALVAILAACGSDSNGPSDKFSGTWTGTAIANDDTVNLELIAGQNGNAVTGNGIISSGGASAPLTFSGTSAPPSVNLTIVFETDTMMYAGSYVSSDSISGVVSQGGVSAQLSFKKQ